MYSFILRSCFDFVCLDVYSKSAFEKIGTNVYNVRTLNDDENMLQDH